MRDIAVAVAEQIHARSWGTSLALQQLIKRMSEAREPGLRLTAAAALHAWGKAARWDQAWMIEVLSGLRNDSNASVTREAFTAFCFSE